MTEASDSAAAKVERAEIAHAVEYAAGLEVFKPRQGDENYAYLPLEIETMLGEQSFQEDDGFGFILRFRRVIVQVFLENCEIARRGRYERTLPPAEFSQFLKRALQTSKAAGAEGKLGLSSAFSQILSAIGVDASAHARVAASVEHDNAETTESKIEFKIIRCLPGSRWEVGHSELGDPTQLDSFLRGRYFSKPPDAAGDDEESSPLCYLTPLSKRGYSATVELRARHTDCAYIPLTIEHDLRVSVNKARIEKMIVLKGIRQANLSHGLQPPKNEVILARGGLRVGRARA